MPRVLWRRSFKLGADKMYPEEVFESDKGFHVIRWEESKDIDEDEFQEAITEEKKYVRSLKHRQLFSMWLEELTKKAKVERLSTL